MSKRIMSAVIGTVAVVGLGGVALAAATSVSNTPPPAFIPGANSVPDDSTVSTTISLPGSTDDRGGEDDTSSTVDHGSNGSDGSDGSDDSTVTTATATTDRPGGSTPSTSVAGGDGHGHGADDTAPDDHGTDTTQPAGTATSQPDDHGTDSTQATTATVTTQPDDHGTDTTQPAATAPAPATSVADDHGGSSHGGSGGGTVTSSTSAVTATTAADDHGGHGNGG